MKRLSSIDIARGLVMVIMALDHVRDYLHVDAAQSPTDLKTTTPVLFFTRWITHLCAPSFVFLAGTSAWLYLYGAGAAMITKLPDLARARRRFLLKRGLVLIAVEFTLVNFALFFDIHFRAFIFEVIATIGAGMILLSLLSRLSIRAILLIAAILVAGHDAISFIPMPKNPALGFIGSLLFGPGGFPLGGGRLFVIAYPILPWLGILLLGYSAGQLFTRPPEKQKTFFLRTGLAALGGFVVLRFVNGYGDPIHWTKQKNSVYTFLSFMNVNKYPPSLLFTLATLGILFLILAAATKSTATKNTILITYGRVPLFYFIIHLYLIHTIMVVVALLQGHPWSELDFGPFKFGRPAGAGLPLIAVYMIWMMVVIALYPLCRWYGRYKATHPEKTWLRYF